MQRRILGIKPLHAIEEIFIEVYCEEARKRVMLGTPKTPNVPVDNFALVACRLDASHGDARNTCKNDNLWCDHC